MRAATGPAALAALLLLLLLLAACRQDMHDQARIDPLEESAFFADGQGARPLVEGTVARGALRAERELYTGMGDDGQFVAAFPVPVGRATLERGRERYDIFCSPCHGKGGDGRGTIVRRGFPAPRSFHEPRLREARPGYFFDVMTRGFGQMSSYAPQVKPHDRWAIAAYIRVLQWSQDAPVELLTPGDRAALEAAAAVPAVAPAHGVER